MSNQLISNLWNNLWQSHSRVKNLLTFSFASQQQNVNKKVETKENEDNNNNANPIYKKTQLIGLILGPAFFAIIMLFFTPDGLTPEARAVLASTVWIATWWITEAIPIPATSLLPIVLFPLTGALDSGAVTSSYGNSTIFLFLGGFLIALAMERWELHKRIALTIISIIGTSSERIVLGFMIATGFLSMWISNTATAMMMVPIGTAIIYQVSRSLIEKNVSVANEDKNFGRAMMLGIAYSASIGGLATLIGTPPNMILAGVINELYGIQITFASWMMFGLPLTIILLSFAWVYLVKMAFPIKMKTLPGGGALIREQKKALGKASFEEKAVLAVFLLAAFSWITRSFLLDGVIPGIDDTMIAIVAAAILFLIPSLNKRGTFLLDWETAKKVPWGILLLFGGGLAIAAGFRESGLASWIGNQLTVVDGIHFILVLTIVTALVMFLTEITSNTASATMILPIMASLALAIGVHPYALMIPAAIAASCAFMLPVATPPNAVVFASGHLKMVDMARAGFWINIMSIVVIVIAIYFYLPIVWGIDLQVVPEMFKG
ncbi:SLC13 family permease [Alkalihalobacterium alkalinitrilicum]|uniref:SLC13 family permease n=1 Tax=Alkalihalobacterium alkalinitrilicum TaxID=427920 RepID=UPI0009956199|nr:DASS family sodium-coupled anion symporter [Alkalihalobacterium alkalinitrilicum]